MVSIRLAFLSFFLSSDVKNVRIVNTVVGVWFKGLTMIIRARVNRRLAIFEWEPVETKKWIDVSILQMEEFGTHMLTVTVNGVREFVALNKGVVFFNCHPGGGVIFPKSAKILTSPLASSNFFAPPSLE